MARARSGAAPVAAQDKTHLVAVSLASEGRDDAAILKLQTEKKKARDRLREARAEMARLDAELVKNGATGLDLNLMCW